MAILSRSHRRIVQFVLLVLPLMFLAYLYVKHDIWSQQRLSKTSESTRYRKNNIYGHGKGLSKVSGGIGESQKTTKWQDVGEKASLMEIVPELKRYHVTNDIYGHDKANGKSKILESTRYITNDLSEEMGESQGTTKWRNVSEKPTLIEKVPDATRHITNDVHEKGQSEQARESQNTTKWHNFVEKSALLKPTATENIYGTGCRENPFHERFKTLLRYWEAIAARRNITQYFVCFGSMLGSFRDGDVVPYDHDIDVCMFRRDLYKLEPEDSQRPFKYNDGQPHMILQRNCHHPKADIPRQDCNGKVVTKYVDACSIIDPCGRILLGSPPFLDVFAIKDNNEELLDEYKRVTHKRNIILPVKPCHLMGIATKCPNNSTAYLERYYGKDFATKSHYVCRDGKWVATGRNVKPIAVPL